MGLGIFPEGGGGWFRADVGVAWEEADHARRRTLQTPGAQDSECFSDEDTLHARARMHVRLVMRRE